MLLLDSVLLELPGLDEESGTADEEPESAVEVATVEDWNPELDVAATVSLVLEEVSAWDWGRTSDEAVNPGLAMQTPSIPQRKPTPSQS